MRKFSESGVFEYNKAKKIAIGLVSIIVVLAIAGFIASYFVVLKNSDSFLISFFRGAVNHITSNISGSTIPGIFYSTLIGGLFFIFLPVELFFANFLRAGHSFVLVVPIFMSGIIISYTLNYYIGLKFSFISKKLISPKKFYKIKGMINRYGGVIVYAFNATPLASQALAAILGVFKYNRTRFYFYVILGQLTKLTVIAMGVNYFL
jgi:membrane protein YqaA with SNARE-associated domain